MRTKEEVELRLKKVDKLIAENKKFFREENLNRYDIEDLNEELDVLKNERKLLLWFLN
tara:strand:+ start:1675 stop:1848 length:174 start_codon:yes stop_codon:yes gene_type:complete